MSDTQGLLRLSLQFSSPFTTKKITVKVFASDFTLKASDSIVPGCKIGNSPDFITKNALISDKNDESEPYW